MTQPYTKGIVTLAHVDQVYSTDTNHKKKRHRLRQRSYHLETNTFNGTWTRPSTSLEEAKNAHEASH